MSLIEKAVERLSQLKQAGNEPPLAALREPTIGEPALGAALPPAGEVRIAPLLREVSSGEVATGEVATGEVGAGEGERAPPGAEPPAAVLDLARLTQAGMVTPDLPGSAIAEEFRVIKRPLIDNARGRGVAEVERGNLIMITSALPGEGKSFTAINLAMSLAMEQDSTVLLVDADVSRPSVLQRLGLPQQKGLMDVLAGDEPDLTRVILRTNIAKLALLPAGMPHQCATELIASEAMRRLVDEIACRYADRIIVFDSPPLLATTEARVLATHMGQVVVVVESGRTTHGAVRQALATIESCPLRLLLLNKSAERRRSTLYGYEPGYGYGYAEPRAQDEAA